MLQENHPRHSTDDSYLAEEFKDFTDSTGSHLNYNRPEIVRAAEWMLNKLTVQPTKDVLKQTTHP